MAKGDFAPEAQNHSDDKAKPPEDVIGLIQNPHFVLKVSGHAKLMRSAEHAARQACEKQNEGDTRGAVWVKEFNKPSHAVSLLMPNLCLMD
jgi:hypothetical protein